MTKITCLFLLLASFALANPAEDSHLSSTNASYDGNALVLEGRVKLDHGLGKMSADKASLQKQQEAGKDFPFSLIHLQKEVLLSLKNKAELKCDTAELDFQNLTGKLVGHEDNFVSYTSSAPTSVRMLSKLLDLQFNKKELETNALQYSVDSLKASQEIQIEYAGEFSLKADEATYKNENTTSDAFQGILKAYAPDTGFCTLSYQGEKIRSDSILVNTIEQKLFLKNPRGTLPSKLFSSSEVSSLSFECGDLIWDQVKETLLLKENIEIQEDSIGSLYSKQDLFIEQGNSGDKKFVKSLHINGLSHLKRENDPTGWNHSLTCFGTLHVDGQKGQVTLTSPTEKGKVIEEKQLLYTDAQMVLHSDMAFIEYSDQTYQPISLTLKGHVKVESSDLSKPIRCGLADRLTYSPNTETVILSALPNKRVLFTDEEQGLNMSAQEVHLTKDPQSGKMQIKGVGNVKFSLSPEESSLLEQGIPSYKTLKSS